MNTEQSHNVVALKCFYHGILQRDYRKMTIKWSFSYNSFLKLSLYYWRQSVLIDPKHSIIKGRHCAMYETLNISLSKIHTSLNITLDFCCWTGLGVSSWDLGILPWTFVVELDLVSQVETYEYYLGLLLLNWTWCLKLRRMNITLDFCCWTGLGVSSWDLWILPWTFVVELGLVSQVETYEYYLGLLLLN